MDETQVLHASMKAEHEGEVWNIVDDDPASREEVEDFVRCILEDECTFADPEGDWDGSSDPSQAGIHEPQSRNLEEKRVKNNKAKCLVGHLEFPTYKEGLTAIWHGDRRPFQV